MSWTTKITKLNKKKAALKTAFSQTVPTKAADETDDSFEDGWLATVYDLAVWELVMSARVHHQLPHNSTASAISALSFLKQHDRHAYPAKNA